MHPDDNPPAVLYAAKSTEDKHGSIPDQRERTPGDGRAARPYRSRGDEYDEGFSAYSGNRGPGLERAKALAIEIAEREGRCFLIALHSDRIARGAGDEPEPPTIWSRSSPICAPPRCRSPHRRGRSLRR